MGRAFLLVLGLVGAIVTAPGSARAETLLLVEVPGPVETALRTALAPWGVEIVVVAPAPAAYDPAALAGEREASFVAWRRGRELVLYDASAASEETRPVSLEPDEAEAAAVALSIKTWMGLGAPPDDGVVCVHDCPRPRPREHRWLAEAALGVRFDVAGQGGADFRYGLAGGGRRGRYEGGLRVDFGADREGTAFGREGAWAVTGYGLWARARFEVLPSISVLPGLGLGLVHSSFTAPRAAPGDRSDAGSADAFGADVEVAARWQRGRISAGVRLGLTAIPRSQTLESRNLEHTIGAHVEPWALATMSVGL